MRLKVSLPTSSTHTELVGALGWNVWNELFTCSDDQTICKWNMLGEPEGQVCKLDAYYTAMHWYPVSSKKNQAGGTDVFAVACTDGSFKIVGRSGRVEKSVEAHRGAVVTLRWTYDGTALATGGEDGIIKIWSRNGMLRSTLVQTENAVYSLVWSADCDKLLFTNGCNLTIRSLQASTKQTTWKAHDGTVLQVDWSPINNMIISGGEDCKYKVWDSFGRLLYQSSNLESAVTSVAWCPNGDQFAVGSFDSIRLCDRMGWTCSKVRTRTGSILGIAWTADGTQMAGSGGSGTICLGQLVDMSLEDGRVHAVLEEDHKITVHDILSETTDDLDFRDRVIKISLGFGHLIVATSTQCHIYSNGNWNTPHIFDLKDSVNLIMQCERCFLMIDNSTGIQIYTYEGRPICNPKFQGLRTEFLNKQMVSLSNDTLAILDQSGATTIRFFDTAQGKALGEPFTHTMEIRDIGLNQPGNATDRQAVFIDRNRDLYIMPVLKRVVMKLAAMVDSVLWHDTTAMLAAMADQRLNIWYYPNVLYVDKDLVNQTKYVKQDADFGKAAQVQLFTGSKAMVRRSDGALVMVAVSPYPQVLYDLVRTQQWEKATRLCRVTKDTALWASLAAMAMDAKDLNTAEAAFAAIDEVDKLAFVLHVKNIPTEEGRNAELALYRRRADEAEAILIQAGLTYRAIKMNVKLFQWDRALELASNYNQHIDTVLYYRQKYLASAKQQETNKKFIQKAKEVMVDEETVKQKVADEKVREAQRPGASKYI